jgi:hypothetical protein
MIKIFLSIFALLLMPMRFLFLISILLNILLFISINSFIAKDTYFESADYTEFMKAKAEKALDRSCSYSTSCSLKLYAKNEKQELKETFFKVINDEKQVKKAGFIESIKAPIQKILSQNELKHRLLKGEKKGLGNCFEEPSGTLTCAGEEIVAIFTAKKCEICIQNFQKEFKNLDKKYYKGFLIKMSHKLHGFIFELFGIKPKNEVAEISTKVKGFIYENL